MNARIAIAAVSVAAALLLAACAEESPSPEATSDASTSATSSAPAGTSAGRWYTAERVERGAALYAENCASCHGDAAEGAFGWRSRDAQGKLPPPPLDGTGHAWHHPFRALAGQIKFGTPGEQGTMPAFDDALTDKDIVDVIAWFQSRWPDGAYAAWYRREAQARAANQ